MTNQSAIPSSLVGRKASAAVLRHHEQPPGTQRGPRVALGGPPPAGRGRGVAGAAPLPQPATGRGMRDHGRPAGTTLPTHGATLVRPRGVAHPRVNRLPGHRHRPADGAPELPRMTTRNGSSTSSGLEPARRLPPRGHRRPPPTALVARLRAGRDVDHRTGTAHPITATVARLPRRRAERRGRERTVLGRGGRRRAQDILVPQPPAGRHHAAGRGLPDAAAGTVHGARRGRPRARNRQDHPGAPFRGCNPDYPITDASRSAATSSIPSSASTSSVCCPSIGAGAPGSSACSSKRAAGRASHAAPPSGCSIRRMVPF